jgi:hypothetical protein
MLQTQFAEYTWLADGPPPAGRAVRADELSLPSPEVTLATRNLTPAERDGSFYAGQASSRLVSAQPGGAKASKLAAPLGPFKRNVLLANGVLLRVNGPGDVQADGGVNRSFV